MQWRDTEKTARKPKLRCLAGLNANIISLILCASIRELAVGESTNNVLFSLCQKTGRRTTQKKLSGSSSLALHTREKHANPCGH